MARRLATLILVALAISLPISLFASCGPAADGPVTPEGPVTLRVSLWDYNPQYDYAFFEEFENSHENIKLQIESESWGNYYTKLQMQLIAGNAPDVIMFNANRMYAYCERGTLLDISMMIEADSFDLGGLFANSVASAQWKGKTYGLPFSNDVSALFLNVDMFRSCNVTVPPHDSAMSWADFEDICGRLSECLRTGEDDAVDYVYLEDIGWRHFYSAVLQNDATPFDLLEDPQRCMLDSPAAIEAAEFYFGLSLEHGYAPNILEYVSVLRQNPSDLFIRGKAPIYMGRVGESFLQEWGPDLGFEMKVVPPFRGEKRVAFADAVVVAINSQTKHQDEAWELVKYFVSPEAQRFIATGEAMNRRIPSLREIAYSDSFRFADPTVSVVFLDELDHSLPLLKTTKVDELGQAMSAVLEQLAMKQISVEEAMALICEEANKILNEG